MDDKKTLISIYQNTQTAAQSINDLLNKTNSKPFKDLLNSQYKKYIDFNNKVEKLALAKEIQLKDNSWFEKAKLWTSIQMETLTNNSTRHLAELMLIGTVMGTLTCYKTKNDNPSASQEALLLLDELETLEENCFNELKKYLKEHTKK